MSTHNIGFLGEIRKIINNDTWSLLLSGAMENTCMSKGNLIHGRLSAILYKGDKFVTFDLGSCRLQASSRHGSALKGKNLQSCTIAYTGDGSST